MNRTPLWTALAAALVIGGCATSGNDSASSTASGSAGSQSSATSSAAPAPAPAPSSQLSNGRGSSSTARLGQPGARSVYYEFDKSDLSAEDRRLVEQHARYLRANPGSKARIEGNTDERGSSEYNLALGQRRAEGVMKALRAGGVQEDRLEAVSYGKEKPKADGHDEKSWSENRRSDINYR
jgi:peptidoglycan-associated lipoprotein